MSKRLVSQCETSFSCAVHSCFCRRWFEWFHLAVPLPFLPLPGVCGYTCLDSLGVVVVVVVVVVGGDGDSDVKG